MYASHNTTLGRQTMSPGDEGTRAQGVIETRIWIEEHDFLHGIYASPENTSPRFGFPDLISACVSLMFAQEDPAARIFGYLRSTLVLRDPETPRRRAELWRAQFELLLDLQRSPANRHPNPMYQLDQLTTACVALVAGGVDKSRIFEHARKNTAERAAS